jgi:hypothetical protein
MPAGRARLVVSLLVLVLSLAGCKKKPSSEEMEALIKSSLAKSSAEEKAKKKPEEPKVLKPAVPTVPPVRITNRSLTRSDPVEMRAREIYLSGVLGPATLALPEDLTLELTLRGSPGTAVKIGEGSLVLPAGGEAKHRLDLKPPLLAVVKGLSLKPGKVDFPRDLTIPVELSKDGATTRGAVRVDPKQLAIRWTDFAVARSRPLTLAGEAAGTNRRASLVHNGILHLTHMGAPTTWENLDLVSAEYYGKMRTRGCGVYRNSAGVRLKLEIFLNDKTATVIDRRTGKRIASKKFLASGTCPRSTRISDSNRSFYADSDKLIAWLAKQLKN